MSHYHNTHHGEPNAPLRLCMVINLRSL